MTIMFRCKLTINFFFFILNTKAMRMLDFWEVPMVKYKSCTNVFLSPSMVIHPKRIWQASIHTEEQWSRSRALDCNRGDGGSIPPTVVSKLRQFRPPYICMGLSEETLKAGGPFYLVSMPREVKDLTQGVNV